MLPYLRREADVFSRDRVRADWMARALLADHVRVRADVDRIEACKTGPQVRPAIEALLIGLDQHMRHEQARAYARDLRQATADDGERAWWALSLLHSDDIDLETLPPAYADTLVLTRLQQMRRGDVLRLRAGHDLHPLWQVLDRRTQGRHGWVYQQTGPAEWIVAVTRREPEAS